MNINKKNGQRGAALVEFTLVVPLLLLFLFGIIEFSVILYDKAVITNASREAAREWVVHRNEADKYNPTQIEAAVLNYTNNRLISFGGSGLTISTSPSNLHPDGYIDYDRGDSLTVSVSYEYDFLLLPALAQGLLPTLTLRAETRMRAE